MEMNLDIAIELLEITDISKITEGDLSKISRKAKARWHPDRVSHLKDPIITNEYEEKSKSIDDAIALVLSFLNGSYHSGQKTKNNENFHTVQPEDIIRENASEMQSTLRNLWNEIKTKKYKLSVEEVVVSDGFKLKDLLNEDFKEDIAMLSIVSLFYGLIFYMILTAILYAISPVLGYLGGIVILLHVISCFLGFLPLSRFWLKPALTDIIFKFINSGLGIYRFAYMHSQNASDNSFGIFIKVLVVMPELFAKAVKYMVLFPIYKLAEAFIGDKIVGVIKSKVNYYAQLADWYIEELLNKQAFQFTTDELFHLSHIYTELSDVKAYYPEMNFNQTTYSENCQDNVEQNIHETTSNKKMYEYESTDLRNENEIQSNENNHFDVPEPEVNNEDEVPDSMNHNNTFTNLNENIASNGNLNNTFDNLTLENMSSTNTINNKPQSVFKIVLISIFFSVLLSISGFVVYKRFIEDNPVRDAKSAYKKFLNCNKNFYQNKEKAYNDLLNEYVNSTAISSDEIIEKLEVKLKSLEAKRQIELEDAQKSLEFMRNKYLADKNAFESFDYAFGLLQRDFINMDSINVIPLIEKANKILGVNTSNINLLSKLNKDIIGQSVFGWGNVELDQATNLHVLTKSMLGKNTSFNVSVLLKNEQGVKAIADLAMIYDNNNQIINIKTSKITYQNTAFVDKWFVFKPIQNADIQVNTLGHSLIFRSCTGCPESKMYTEGNNTVSINYSEEFQIKSDESTDVTVDFSYIPYTQ